MWRRRRMDGWMDGWCRIRDLWWGHKLAFQEASWTLPLRAWRSALAARVCLLAWAKGTALYHAARGLWGQLTRACVQRVQRVSATRSTSEFNGTKGLWFISSLIYFVWCMGFLSWSVSSLDLLSLRLGVLSTQVVGEIISLYVVVLSRISWYHM